MNTLIDYWPSLDAIAECLRPEAETVDEALLLAVHEPVALLRRSDLSAKDTLASESDLLTELLRPATDGSAVVVAITGASGVGKSHMVRWLHAQLKRHPKRNDFVVVLIPKTASLRKVVELILEPLAGEAYERLRHDLGRTVEALNVDTTAALLATALGEELKSYAKRIEEDIRAARLGLESRPQIQMAMHLHNIVRDPGVQDQWFLKVLRRIVQSSLGGSADPKERQFQPADLVPPTSGQMNVEVRAVNHALQFLANANGVNRPAAIELLQQVLDPALRTIFRFTEALQQRTIQEVVDDIRKQLLADGKELVLLIEDLAALSGIQQPLLDIMIAEADHGGQRVRAPIRTAVAVTDGFLAARQTVLTRARGQWVVQSEGFTEQAVVDRLIALTGRYLNAARFGLAELRHAYTASGASNHDLYAWVPRFEDQREKPPELDAFGWSKNGHAMFPFNEDAIRSLSSRALKVGDTWILNPRSFINEVLRTVLQGRDLYETGHFPPPNYFKPAVATSVATELQNQGFTGLAEQRLVSALTHWAGNPTRLNAGSTALRTVFEQFNLPWPFAAHAAAPPKAAPRAAGIAAAGTSTTVVTITQGSGAATYTDRPNPAVTGTQADPAEREQSAYALAIEHWNSTTRLQQDIARRTRQLLQQALERRLDLSDLQIKGVQIEAKCFWLPPESNVSNPGAGHFRVKVAEADVPIPVYVKTGLQALDRWDAHAKSWDYSGAEDDYAQASFLLDAIERQMVPTLIQQAQRDACVLMHTLYRQSLLGGSAGSAKPEDAPLRSIATSLPTQPAVEMSGAPTAAQQAMEDRGKCLVAREVLQARLWSLVGCFQGDGSKLMGIDTERVRTAWALTPPERGSVGLKLKRDLPADALDLLARLSDESLESTVRRVCAAMELMRPTVHAAFEDDFDRLSWRDHLSACIERSIQLSLWPTGSNPETVRRAVEYLSSADAEPFVHRVKKMRPDDPTAAPLVRLANASHVSLPHLITHQSHVATLEAFLSAQHKLIRDQSNVDDEAALRRRNDLLTALTWEA